MKRRIFSVLLSSALLLTALAGCGQGGEAAPSGSSSDADSETGTRDELIFVNYRDIRALNPHLYAGEMYAQSILYDTLVSNTEDGYVGCLAEDWTISDDGRIYTFNIRDGVTFSDGTPLYSSEKNSCVFIPFSCFFVTQPFHTSRPRPTHTHD